MTTIEGIPENERQWGIKLTGASVTRMGEDNDTVEIIVSRQDGPGRKRVDAAPPPSRDTVIEFLASQPGVSEQAAETQFEIAEGSMIEYVDGKCKGREVSGYVPCGASRADRWLIPRDSGDDEPTEPSRPDASSDNAGDAGDDSGDSDAGEAARRVSDGGAAACSSETVGVDAAHAADPGGDTFNTGGNDGEQEGWRRYVDPGVEHPVSEQRVVEALNAAQEYFRAELQDIHYRGAKTRWGLSEDTIDAAGFGFCPDRDDLREHLRDRGFDTVEMLATGLFTSGAVKHALNECDDPQECGHDVPEDLELLAAGIRDGEVHPADVDVGRVVQRVEEQQDGVSLYQWWDDRLTIPYRDDDGDVAFFAARATGGTADIVYDDAGDVAKYVKLSKNKPWTHSVVDEPVFCASRVMDDTETVIVTEGLTDALAARQHGYEAVAPATTEFKHDAVEDAVAAVDDAEQVVVIMDNDDPGEGADISPGLNGALKTAAVLRSAGVEAKVGVLPRVDGEETDMADYLKQADGDDPLCEVLADARPPREFEEFDEDQHAVESGDGDSGDGDAGDETVEPADGSVVTADGGAVNSDGSKSALFDLSISDVAPSDAPSNPGDRGRNPFLPPLNSSGKHFRVSQDDETAHDFHESVDATYTPLTWLLCDAGVRDPKSPTGELSDAELFEAWRQAKEQGVIPEDDRIPWRARLHVIRRHDLFPPACLPDGYDPDAIPDSVWEDVAEMVGEEYEVSAGLDWV